LATEIIATDDEFYSQFYELYLSLSTLQAASWCATNVFACNPFGNRVVPLELVSGCKAEMLTLKVDTIFGRAFENKSPLPLEFVRSRVTEFSEQQKSAGFKGIIDKIASSSFLLLFEYLRPKLDKEYGNQPNLGTWPDLPYFCWIIRNSIAHNCTWKLRDPNAPAVKWGNLTIVPPVAPDPLFSGQLGGTDVILLMHELRKFAKDNQL
jgi:hypothetical protein